MEQHLGRNPFDFVRPVTDPDLFAGRRREQEDIEYYLDQAALGGGLHLALVGDRVSGKTSLLNMIVDKAETRRLLAVKVDLDSEKVSQELLFFCDVFDGIVTKGSEFGMLGGSYSEQVIGLRQLLEMAEAEGEQEVLRFPMLYAMSISTGRVLPIPQRVLEDDLRYLREEARKVGIPSIVLLFDEGDLLANNQTLLQRLRNIFSNVEGYMLVLAGTQEMFRALDAVFSPIPRHFKRIPVVPFRDESETADCVMKPLRVAEVPSEDLDWATIGEIHEMSGGSPYEINMLCHFIYRRYRDGLVPKFQLTVEALDDVLEQLEPIRRQLGLVPEGPAPRTETVAKIKGLDQQALHDALEVIPCEQISLRELAILRLAFSDFSEGDLQTARDELEEKCRRLERQGLLSLSHDRFAFRGDTFDRLYLKYHLAAQMGQEAIERVDWHADYPTALARRFSNFVDQEILPTLKLGGGLAIGQTDVAKDELLADIIDDLQEAQQGPWPSPIEFGPVPLILASIAGVLENEYLLLIAFDLSIAGTRRISHLVAPLGPEAPKPERLPALTTGIRETLTAQEDLYRKYRLETSDFLTDIVSPSSLARLSDMSQRCYKVLRLRIQMLRAFRQHDLPKAQALQQEALELYEDSPVPPQMVNALGFICLCRGDFEAAKARLQEAMQRVLEAQASDDEDTNLERIIRANMVYLHAVEGQLDDAEQEAQVVLSQAGPPKDDTALYLKVFIPVDGVDPPRTDGWDLIEKPLVSTVALCSLAGVSARKGGFDKALSNCKQAISRSPGRSYPYRTLAWLHHLMGHFEEAHAALGRAQRAEPLDEWIQVDRELMRTPRNREPGSEG